MQAVSFDAVSGVADQLQRFIVWRGPAGDYAAGQSAQDKPAGYRNVDLTGAVLELTLHNGLDLISRLRSDGASPHIAIEPGVSGRFSITFRPDSFPGVTTGTYNHVLRCLFPDGFHPSFWVGPINLLAAPI